MDVNEAYIAQIQRDQPARITIDAYPDTSFAGRVRQVVPTADRQKATVQVKVSILDRDPRILPEMGAKVVFVREADAAATAVPRRVLVPKEAVVSGGEGSQVWIVAEEKALRRPMSVVIAEEPAEPAEPATQPTAATGPIPAVVQPARIAIERPAEPEPVRHFSPSVVPATA